jgi:hypothetical protein
MNAENARSEIEGFVNGTANVIAPLGTSPGQSQESRVKRPLKARPSKSLLNPPTHGIFRENEPSPHPRHPGDLFAYHPKMGG